MKQKSLIDRCIAEIDIALRTLIPPQHRTSKRINPGHATANPAPLSVQETKYVAGLMRVNHAGEVCAQALYQGQAISARLTTIKSKMAAAAEEEVDHLAWCEERLRELNSQTSMLNPIWYAGSFALGYLAGLAGDQWSLGFVAETENQVSAHLQNHLQQLPSHDQKSAILLKQMQEDEQHHAQDAKAAGAKELPYPIKTMMHYVAKLMTNTSYYV